MAVSLTNPLPPSLDPPNFHVCSLAYGHPIPLSHCLNALSLLPTGSVAVPYSTQLPQTRERFALPFTAIRSLCQITIEVGGRQVPPVVYLVPDKIQELALFVIAQCVREQETGGFATMGLGPLVDYVMNRQEAEGGGDRDRSPYSTTLPSFITVTVNNPTVKVPAPGNNDPAVPLILSRKLSDAAKSAGKDNQLRKGALADAAFWQTAGESINRGGSTPWWKYRSVPSKMAYECDAELGKPRAVDCAHILWNMLGPNSVTPPSDLVKIGPGNTLFLSYQSCVVAVAAAVQISMTWHGIRDVLDYLQDLCLMIGAVLPVAGGRAHIIHGGHALPGAMGKRDVHARRSALNTLPPHVNITIFEQQEPFVNPRVEAKSCTWRAVQERKPVSNCK